MIYIYRRAASNGAVELATALGGRKVQNVPRLRAGDALVCWGERQAPVRGVTVLNGGPLSNKFEDATKLQQEGIPTITVVRQAPRDTPVDNTTPHQRRLESVRDQMVLRLGEGAWDQFQGLLTDFNAARTALQNAARTRTPAHIWIPRLNHHSGGSDLLQPPRRPDYYVRKEEIRREFRVHSFLGQSIRAGEKVHREGVAAPHEWVRSWDAGWRIVYNGVERRGLRELAHRAVAALGLQFGAVDVAETRDNRLIVLEVNRAPGLEGGTITAYANAIRGAVVRG